MIINLGYIGVMINYSVFSFQNLIYHFKFAQSTKFHSKVANLTKYLLHADNAQAISTRRTLEHQIRNT